MRLLIAMRGAVAFIEKALQLVDGIVQLGECVTELHPRGKAFEPLNQAFIIRHPLRQGTEIARVIDQKSGLYERMLAKFREQLVHQFAPIRLGRGFDSAAAHLRAQAIRVGKLLVVDAGSVQNGLAQGQARPGRRKVDGMPLPVDDWTAGHLFGGGGDHLFSAPHHIFIVGVCLVKLELCEFGIVFEADALVAEITPDLVDRGKAADDQPLQIQLEADAQIEVLVELIVVGDERLCGRAAVERLQDRRLDLEETGAVQIGAQRAHDRGPRAEKVARLFVGQQVDVSPAIAYLRIAHAMPFVRHWLERFGQEVDLVNGDAQLAAARYRQRTGCAHEITQIDKPLPHLVVPAVGQVVPLNEKLDLGAAIVQIGETDLAHHADALEPAGHTHGRLPGGAVLIERAGIGDRMGALDPRRIGVDPARPQCGQLLQAALLLVAQVFWVEKMAGIFHNTCSWPARRSSTAAFERRDIQPSTRTISNSISPAGASTRTISPAARPINALPIGLSLLMRPLVGSVSVEPTIV